MSSTVFVSSAKKRMSSLNLNRACSTKQTGSPRSPADPAKATYYWLIPGRLDEADRLARPAVGAGQGDLVLVDDGQDALTEDETVVLVGIGRHDAPLWRAAARDGAYGRGGHAMPTASYAARRVS